MFKTIAVLLFAGFAGSATAQTVQISNPLDLQNALALCVNFKGCTDRLNAGILTPREAVDCMWAVQTAQAVKNGRTLTKTEKLQLDFANRSCETGLERK